MKVVLFCLIYIAIRLEFTVAVLNRDPNFPPKLMRNTFASFKKRCVEESGVTQAMIDQFSDAEDLNKLPEQHELKCYIYCQYREMEMMDTVHPAIQMEILLENVESLGPVASEIFLNMGKKCSRLKYKTTDLCEVAYKFNVCLKKGDIHHYVLL